MANKEKEKSPPHEKPVKIPLEFKEALRALLNIPPPKEDKEKEKSDSE